MPVIHCVKFERNVVTGQWRAMCSCMWSTLGNEDDVKKQAARHDLDEWRYVNSASPANMRTETDAS